MLISFFKQYDSKLKSKSGIYLFMFLIGFTVDQVAYIFSCKAGDLENSQVSMLLLLPWLQVVPSSLGIR